MKNEVACVKLEICQFSKQDSSQVSPLIHGTSAVYEHMRDVSEQECMIWIKQIKGFKQKQIQMEIGGTLL